MSSAAKLIVILTLTAPYTVFAADDEQYEADPETVLRLIRNDKLDLILPDAMRKNAIDMWIHAGRHGDPNPLEYEFGIIDGFLVFTDLGDRIERAMFGGVFTGSGGVENIEVHGSREIARAFAGYEPHNIDPAIFDDIAEFVAERDPQRIAVNYSSWLAVADGISHSQFELLTSILGKKYSERIVSAENLITDFRSRRTLREIVLQANVLETARQNAMEAIDGIRPGETSIGELPHARLLYSATTGMENLDNRDYTLQRGDFLYINGTSEWMHYAHAGFSVDTKYHVYLLQEGESRAPESIQIAFEQAIKGQEIMRPTVRVGMTAGEALEEMVASMENEGYIYTPFTDDGDDDYEMLRKDLAGTDKSGFSVDLHVQGNNDGELITVGPSMAPFRRDRNHLIIPENHIFAFEYMVHTNIPERPGYPLSINISNVQAVSNLGIEWIQPPNVRIHLVH